MSSGPKELIHHLKADALVDLGATISPFNAWLITRGSVTLPLRLKQQFSTAEAVARYLETEDRIAFVTYPGLASHDQHELAKKQFRGKGRLASKSTGMAALPTSFGRNFPKRLGAILM